jgi:hypothetical protein
MSLCCVIAVIIMATPGLEPTRAYLRRIGDLDDTLPGACQL